MPSIDLNQLYLRCYRLTLFDGNGTQIAQYFQSTVQRGLRMEFHVRQQMFMINNIASFRLFNVSLNSMHLIATAKSVVFEAGYADDLKQIHSGRVFNVFGNRMQPDYAVSIFTSDSFANNPPIYLNLSSSNTDVQMIQAVAATVQGLIVQPGNLQGVTNMPVQKNILIDNIEYTQAFELLSIELGLKIWVTNKVLYTASQKPSSFATNTANTTTLNYLNGMIGSPTIDVQNAGIVVKSLLRGNLFPGNYVVVETLSPQVELGLVNFYHFNQDKATRGEWQILTVDHVGDTMGDDWYSQLNGYGLKLLAK